MIFNITIKMTPDWPDTSLLEKLLPLSTNEYTEAAHYAVLKHK